MKRIGKRHAAQPCHDVGDLLGQCGGCLRHLGADDGQLPVPLRVIQPVVQAAPLDRVVELAGAVAGEDGHGLDRRPHRADLRNADLVFTQVLQQECFKRFVRAVHLVNQQHGARRRCFQRLQQRAADQVAVLVDLALDLRNGVAASGFQPGLGGTHVQQLRRVVPLVQSFALLQTVVTLQPQ